MRVEREDAELRDRVRRNFLRVSWNSSGISVRGDMASGDSVTAIFEGYAQTRKECVFTESKGRQGESEVKLSRDQALGLKLAKSSKIRSQLTLLRA